ncbi:MAG: hypothetical protein COA52_11675 [Hyphomicrobiales bacterium]|nr:MAG: hypothetical protein COA52_11675 [Hyphomicrobiales bacterium]
MVGYSREQALDYAAENGISAVEFCAKGWSQGLHLNVAMLLSDAGERDQLTGQLRDRGLEISALNCSGNQLHPGPSGAKDDRAVRDTIELASLMGVERVVMMSGLPAGNATDQCPNWIVSSWPTEAEDMLAWQWNERVLPYWRDLTPVATNKGIKLCIEQHGRQVVYNTESFMRLREAVGPTVGVNFDPSHLFWMGGDAVAAIDALGECIYHVHGKDTRIEPQAAIDGLLDTKHVTPVAPRAWNYVGLGHGHSYRDWLAIVNALRAVGYDDVISIENEDHLLSPEESVSMSVNLLKFAISQGEQT